MARPVTPLLRGGSVEKPRTTHAAVLKSSGKPVHGWSSQVVRPGIGGMKPRRFVSSGWHELAPACAGEQVS